MLTERIEHVALSALTPHPSNPNRGNVEAVAASMRRNGFFGALVVQRATGYVLAGNHRLEAARALDYATVPVIYVDVTDVQASEILVADNRTAELAYRDSGELLAMLDAIALADASALASVGYSDDDLTALRAMVRDEAPTETDGEGTSAADQRRVAMASHFDVLVACGDESAQAALFERLTAEGFACRLLM